MRRYRLNPCDYLFFAHHNMMQRCGQTGNLPFMILELQGDIDRARLDAAVARALSAHPALRTRAVMSRLTGRPSWQPVVELDRPACVHYDLRDSPDWTAEADRLCQDAFAIGWNLFSSPQVRLEQFCGPAGRSRMCLRWPHAMMDAEGAQWFLSEVNRLDAAPDTPPPDSLRPHSEPADPLGGLGWLQRLPLARRGVRTYRGIGRVASGKLASGPARGGRWRYMHRAWSAEQYEILRRRADESCPTGPARFSRYLAACVLQALHTLHKERGIAVDAYLVTLPMKVRGVQSRPVPGNYVVSAALCGRRDVIEDRAALLGELHRQIERFLADDSDRAGWAMMELMSWLREGQYRRLLAWSARHQPYTSGLSHYGEIDPPLRTFLGASVLNFWGCGTMPAPPGWNPAFSRFGDALNLSLAWLDGYYRAATVQRYLELIEEELFRGDAAAERPV